MDAHTRAIPDFFLTMSQAMQYVEHRFLGSRKQQPVQLRDSLQGLLFPQTKPPSAILQNYWSLVGHVVLAGAPYSVEDSLSYLLCDGSFKSIRDRVYQTVSTHHRKLLYCIARDELKPWLSENPHCI